MTIDSTLTLFKGSLASFSSLTHTSLYKSGISTDNPFPYLFIQFVYLNHKPNQLSGSTQIYTDHHSASCLVVNLAQNCFRRISSPVGPAMRFLL
ncbi:hypothetical protein F0562_000505 [Nyssa sinensis]|uniref:Uncharacterized protein n=1 Tax=Nyssa sinensis TaxID=561372 RepID=A0A5J5C5E2_9ASTE|nr:hypothetical protein F0562_000505 [Nyssa sinensis]